MSDPLSLAAGVVGITAFAIQSSKTLYEVLDKVKNNGKTIRELREEITGLSGVLLSLQETLNVAEADFTSLQAPLLRCGRLCEEISALVERCSSREGKGRFSLRDFLLFTYKGKNIEELRSLIAVYKSTIAIALADANIRQVTITTKLLQEYRQKIDDTTGDLDELLQRYEDESDSPPPGAATNTQPQGILDANIDGERASIEECLRICAQVSKHIDQVQQESALLKNEPVTLNYKGVSLTKTGQAGHITSQRLQNCKAEIGLTSAELRLLLQEVEQRVARLAMRPSVNGRSSADENGVSDVEELKGIRESLSICQGATEQAASNRVNVFEEVSTDDDGNQVIVSTFGDLISARHVKVGARSTQLLGQMSDASLQHISSGYAVRYGSREEPGRTSSDRRSPDKEASSSRFTGAGRKLS